MRTLTIEKILLMIPFLFMEPQPDVKVERLERIEYNEPVEAQLLKQSIENSESKIKVLQAEADLKDFFKSQPFKSVKQ
jgi:hypothetical protein